MPNKRRLFIERLKEDITFRTLFFACLSFAMNVAFGLFNGVQALLYLSFWNASLAAYYILLAFLRGGVLQYHRKRRKRQNAKTEISENSEDEKLRQAKNYRSRGILLLFIHLALSVAIVQMVFSVHAFEYPGWTIYGAAAFAFYNVTMSIINIRRARKTDDCTLRAVRGVNLASSMVSILTLQTALLSTFNQGEVNADVFNGATGAAVTLLTIGLGIFMIVDAQKIINALQKEETYA